jgi:Na+(H+)/acetate symporter ActP
MPQFLKTRYNESVALVMAIFWLLLYVFVNFTSILYLGAVAINGLLGGDYLHLVMIGLMLMALIITLGGMKVIGYTDVIQVAVLIIGGFATVYMALQIVDQRINHVIDGSALAGFNTLLSQAPEHFHLILPKPNNTDMSAAGQLARDKYNAEVNFYIAGIGICVPACRLNLFKAVECPRFPTAIMSVAEISCVFDVPAVVAFCRTFSV